MVLGNGFEARKQASMVILVQMMNGMREKERRDERDLGQTISASSVQLGIRR